MIVGSVDLLQRRDQPPQRNLGFYCSPGTPPYAFIHVDAGHNMWENASQSPHLCNRLTYSTRHEAKRNKDEDTSPYQSLVSALPSLSLPPLPLIIPLPPILPLDPLDPFPSPLASHRPSLSAKPILLPLDLLIIQLNQPVPLSSLIPALVTPLLHPFAGLLVVHQVLAPLFQHGPALGTARELADALLACELLPRCGLFGFGQRFPPRQWVCRGWEGHGHAVPSRCDGAGR